LGYNFVAHIMGLPSFV